MNGDDMHCPRRRVHPRRDRHRGAPRVREPSRLVLRVPAEVSEFFDTVALLGAASAELPPPGMRTAVLERVSQTRAGATASTGPERVALITRLRRSTSTWIAAAAALIADRRRRVRMARAPGLRQLPKRPDAGRDRPGRAGRPHRARGREGRREDDRRTVGDGPEGGHHPVRHAGAHVRPGVPVVGDRQRRTDPAVGAEQASRSWSTASGRPTRSP